MISATILTTNVCIAMLSCCSVPCRRRALGLISVLGFTHTMQRSVARCSLLLITRESKSPSDVCFQTSGELDLGPTTAQPRPDTSATYVEVIELIQHAAVVIDSDKPGGDKVRDVLDTCSFRVHFYSIAAPAVLFLIV